MDEGRTRDRAKMWTTLRDLDRGQIAIHFRLLSKVRNGRDDTATVSLDVLLNGDADLCPHSSRGCEPVGFLGRREGNQGPVQRDAYCAVVRRTERLMLWGLFECRCSRRPEREFKVYSTEMTLSDPTGCISVDHRMDSQASEYY